MKLKLSILFLIFSSQILLAQDCLTGWDWYRPLTIHNNGNTAMTDCQIPFDLSTGVLVSDGKLQMNGADIRITDTACNVIPYFIAKPASDSANTIWLKLSIPANDSAQLELYYGNATADSMSDGEDIFIFFDDFSADTVNPAKWEAIGGYENFYTDNGMLNYSSNGANPGPRFKFARTVMSFDEAVHFDYSARISNSNGVGFSSADSTITRILFRQSSFGFDTLNQVAYMQDTVSNGFQVEGLYPMIRYPRNEFKDASIRAWIQNDTLTMDYFANLTDNSVSNSVYQLTQEQMSGFHFIVSSFLGSQTIRLDYLRVRKPLPDEANVALGEEIMATPNSIDKPNSTVFLNINPNPTHGQINIEGLPSGRFSVELINVQGQIVSQENVLAFEGQPLSMKLNKVPAGFYWLSFSDENGIIASKSIVIRAN